MRLRRVWRSPARLFPRRAHAINVFVQRETIQELAAAGVDTSHLNPWSPHVTVDFAISLGICRCSDVALALH